jgi:predicted DsbA family dithiol-disulfide isomerase
MEFIANPNQGYNRTGGFTEESPFEVTIISDFVCAWCMIGKKSLEIASNSLGIPLRCIWQPYIINPNTPPEGEDIIDHLIKKFGAEGAERFLREGSPIEASAARVGLRLNPKRRMVPSLNAHRLVEWCKVEHTHHSELLVNNIFDAYYGEALDISNTKVLTEIARRSGLNPAEAHSMLVSSQYKREVIEKDLHARSRQRVSGVPSFTITYRTARKPFNFSGAQPPEVMVQFIQEASKMI